MEDPVQAMLYMFVPEFPVVNARGLMILVFNAKLTQQLMKTPVWFEQKIFGPARNINVRQMCLAASDSLGQFE